ncbi:MAG: phosphatidylglycerol lysyltransferase domain-containing protein [Gammaproteobacteria bacterium]|nr:phosphatidylglycerol lysyltransferase domain-containing protein [Gammaproteobacteria bacterium]
MLNQLDEPPGSRPRDTRLRWSEPNSTPDNVLTLHVNTAFPNRYLAIEGHKLYPFTTDIKPLFETYQRRSQVPLSDYTFANNIIWLSQKSGFYQIIEDCFCLFCLTGDGLTMPLPPLGAPEHQYAALAACFEIMDGYNATPYLGKVEFVYRAFLQVMPLHLEEDTVFPTVSDGAWLVERSLPDYIYSTSDLIELKGNAYKTKRNEINQFRRAHPNHALVPFSRAHEAEARALVNTWMQNRLQTIPDVSFETFVYNLEMERKAIQRAITLYDQLGLEGLSLFIDGRLAGFTFGERLNRDVANVLIEKTNFNIQGAAQFLFREFSKVFTDCTYINVGDDLGFENLRRVKMSYRPAMFGEKVILRRPLPE